MNKFFEFLSIGIVTPILYVMYAVMIILFTFILGLPFAVGIYLIQMAMGFIFSNGGFHAGL
jgi:hypothetical protein